MKKRLKEWHDIWENKARRDSGRLPAVVSGFDEGRGQFTREIFEIMVKEIQDGLNILLEHSLLEVGCGAGMLLDYFRHKCKRVVGVDFFDFYD